MRAIRRPGIVLRFSWSSGKGGSLRFPVACSICAWQRELPEGPEDQALVAAAMDFGDYTEFMTRLDVHRERVARHFIPIVNATDALARIEQQHGG